MPNRARGLRAYDLARVARALSREPATLDALAEALGYRRETARNYLRALRQAGALLALDDRRRYSLAMAPAEIVALLETIAAPKTQATSRACAQSTSTQK